MPLPRPIILLFLSILSLPCAHAGSSLLRGTVIRVSDGDTIQLQPESTAQNPTPKKVSIRFKEVDTPEVHLTGGNQSSPATQGYWGEEASRQLKRELPAGTRVEVEVTGTDSYGRGLGYVFKNGVDQNLRMLGSGWATFYMICAADRCDLETTQLSKYREACNQAVERGFGNFNPLNPLPELPFLFRARIQQKELHRFVGNMKTKTYVSPREYLRVPLCDRVFFDTESFAQRNGYRPAMTKDL
jgi:2',3'-cyclic-nucleotide 2'-phosphodiesterase / 3'-nucleotidase / 5'-nucleotidase